jgi:hypothetical protein
VEALAAAFDHAQPPTLSAIDRRELIEMDDAVSDTVYRSVRGFGREIVKHHDGGIVLGEIVFECENLPAVAEGTLRQETNFGEAVEHDPLRFEPLDGIEDTLNGLSQLEIGGIEQALMLRRIEHALGRHELNHLDRRANLPIVRAGAVPQLSLSFSEAYVDPGLAVFRAAE